MLWRRPAAQSFSSLQELHLVGETAAQLQVGALVLGTPEAIGLRSKLQQVLLVCPNVAGFHSPLLLRRFIPQTSIALSESCTIAAPLSVLLRVFFLPP